MTENSVTNFYSENNTTDIPYTLLVTVSCLLLHRCRLTQNNNVKSSKLCETTGESGLKKCHMIVQIDRFFSQKKTRQNGAAETTT